MFWFSCITTSAVYIEIAPSLDTSSYVIGRERFIARRGMKIVFWSDNWTIFDSAENDLTPWFSGWKRRAPSHLVHKGINENLINWQPCIMVDHGESCLKLWGILHSYFGSCKLTDEALSTTFSLVESSLIVRLVTPKSLDPPNLEALTPYHVLFAEHCAVFLYLFAKD